MSSYSGNASQQNPGWGSAGEGVYWRRGRCGGAYRWRPLEIVAMVLGFMLFWPIGLAVVGFKIWQKSTGYPGDLASFAQEKADWARNACRSWQGEAREARRRWSGGGFGGGMRPTGNSAFDEWRSAELARLEEERRKLEEAEREFAAHIDELRRARDREEFERFMNARRNRPSGDAPSPQP